MRSVPKELRDFRNFLFLVWCHLNLPKPTPVQYDLAHYLQHGPRRRIVEAFRGVGKSWITVAYVLWRLKLDPELKVLVVSASKNLADNFSTFCFQLINTMPLLEELRADPSKGQRDSKIQFDVGPAQVSKDPSVRSVGITGQLTGGRADLIIADDIETPNNSSTQTSRDKLSELVKEFDSVLKPNGEIIYLGTPQTELSIYNLLPKRGYQIRVWPARYPDERLLARVRDRLAPFILEALDKDPALVGSPTDPQRFSDMDLCEREASYGRSGFSLQFMLDTSLSDLDRYPLRLSDLIVMSVPPEVAPEKIVWANDPALAWDDSVPCVGLTNDRYHRPMKLVGDFVPYQGTVLAIDPAGRGADELGYCVAKSLNGYIYIPACGGLKGGYSETNLEFLAKLAKKHEANLIIYESNFGDGMFGELFKPVLSKHYACTVEEVRHSTQKERRIIDTLEPVMNQHKLVVDPEVIQKDFNGDKDVDDAARQSYMLFHQMSRITRDRGCLRHDDRLDALAIAVSHWTTSMAQSDEKKMAQRQHRLLVQELNAFKKHVFGAKPKAKNWLHLR